MQSVQSRPGRKAPSGLRRARCAGSGGTEGRFEGRQIRERRRERFQQVLLGIDRYRLACRIRFALQTDPVEFRRQLSNSGRLCFEPVENFEQPML